MYNLILAIVKRIETNVILRYTRTQIIIIIIIIIRTSVTARYTCIRVTTTCNSESNNTSFCSSV